MRISISSLGYWSDVGAFGRFRVDGGKPPGIQFGGSARRCRVLLSHTLSTVLDLRLFAQVEVCHKLLYDLQTC